MEEALRESSHPSPIVGNEGLKGKLKLMSDMRPTVTYVTCRLRMREEGIIDEFLMIPL